MDPTPRTDHRPPPHDRDLTGQDGFTTDLYELADVAGGESYNVHDLHT